MAGIRHEAIWRGCCPRFRVVRRYSRPVIRLLINKGRSRDVPARRGDGLRSACHSRPERPGSTFARQVAPLSGAKTAPLRSSLGPQNTRASLRGNLFTPSGPSDRQEKGAGHGPFRSGVVRFPIRRCSHCSSRPAWTYMPLGRRAGRHGTSVMRYGSQNRTSKPEVRKIQNENDCKRPQHWPRREAESGYRFDIHFSFSISVAKAASNSLFRSAVSSLVSMFL